MINLTLLTFSCKFQLVSNLRIKVGGLNGNQSRFYTIQLKFDIKTSTIALSLVRSCSGLDHVTLREVDVKHSIMYFTEFRLMFM